MKVLAVTPPLLLRDMFAVDTGDKSSCRDRVFDARCVAYHKVAQIPHCIYDKRPCLLIPLRKCNRMLENKSTLCEPLQIVISAWRLHVSGNKILANQNHLHFRIRTATEASKGNWKGGRRYRGTVRCGACDTSRCTNLEHSPSAVETSSSTAVRR